MLRKIIAVGIMGVLAACHGQVSPAAPASVEPAGAAAEPGQLPATDVDSAGGGVAPTMTGGVAGMGVIDDSASDPGSAAAATHPPSKAEIQRVIRARNRELGACGAGQAGKLVMRIGVAASGAVTTAMAEPDRSTLHDPGVVACVARVLVQLRFSTGPAQIAYPVLFVADAAPRSNSAAVAVALIESRFKVSEGLSRSQIADAIAGQHEALRRCYQEVLAGNEEVEGPVQLSFTIDAEGKVTRVAAPSPSPSLRRCVVGVIQKTRFAQPEHGKVVEVSYPLRFQRQ